jgi:hypothetical protein
MMRHVFHSALALAVAAAGTMTVAAAAQQPTFNTNRQATFVMKNGDRHTGTLVYHNDNNFNLIQNGQERPFPIADVALVDFAGGDPAAAELTQLPTSANPPELRRHMLVLRDGRVVHGKLYTIKENALTIDPQGGGREDFDLADVARLYVSAPASRHLYAAQLQAAQQAVAGTAGNVPANIPAGAIQVDGARAWTDTGLTVRKGDRLGFSTTGQVAIRPGALVTPDGSSERDNGAPVPVLGVGGLIARVGTGRPFPIGSNSTLITMPANGKLYLGINDTGLSDNSGAFIVTIVR